MGSAQLILVRHGQAMLGTDDYDRLSPLGRQQSVALSERLHAEVCDHAEAWHGRLRRHAQTYQHLQRPSEPTVAAALDEYEVQPLIEAALQQAEVLGITPPEPVAWTDPARFLATFLAWFPEVLSCWQQQRLQCSHNGDWAGFLARVCSPLPQWQASLQAGRSVLVVSSAGVISTVLAQMLDEDLSWQRQTNVALYNASMSVVEWQADQGWQLCRLNCTEHLSPAQHSMA